MLRVLYCWLLHAHPPYFRQRFAEEMQSIFDSAVSRGAQVGLFVDGVLSLMRQWSLRPQFWEKPTLVADDAPLFHTFDSFKPRIAALFYGALLSAFVLNGISWTMGYAWNHPIFIEIRQPIITPPAFWAVRNPPHPTTTVQVEPWLYTDQGRVVLIFNAPARSESPCGEQANLSASRQVGSGTESGPCPATPEATTPQVKNGMVF